MINDGYWKKELKFVARRLAFFSKWPSVLGGYGEHQINKYVLLSAVFIRKLFEDEKSADIIIKKNNWVSPRFDILNKEIAALRFDYINEDHLSFEKFAHEFYSAGNECFVSIDVVCNQIIHSYTWDLAYNNSEKGIYGFIVASDRFKEKEAYFIDLKDWIELLKFCAENAHIY